MLVSSPSSGEGKSTVAINLAVVLSSRRSTCLVDGDLRRPMVASTFGLRAKAGLSDVLVGKCSLAETLLKIPDVPNLSVLCGGHYPPNAADLVASEQMEAILIALRDQYDHVVIDSPPVIPFSDARVLAPLSDVVVLVGRYGMTTRRALMRSVQLLSDARASVVGVVLNAIDLASADYRYFNYGSARTADEGLYDDANHKFTMDGPSDIPAVAKSKGAHA